MSTTNASELEPADAARLYTRWLPDWFEHDVGKLNDLYCAVTRPLV